MAEIKEAIEILEQGAEDEEISLEYALEEIIALNDRLVE